MSESLGAGASPVQQHPQKVLLVGNPNVGKSVLFHLLTGTYAVVSNYPGTTVEVTRGQLRGIGWRPEVIDTPGINTLTPLSLDEMVTRDILLTERDYVVIQVIDARNLTRGLRITAELAELQVPMVIALNMVDEALRAGININAEKLSDVLGVSVVPTVAVERRGISELLQALRQPRVPRLQTEYPAPVEQVLNRVTELLPDLPVGKRAVAVMLLAGDEGIERWLAQRVAPTTLHTIAALRHELQEQMPQPLDYLLAAARWEACDAIADLVTVHRPVSVSRVREVVSAATMHPVWGPLILLVVLASMYFVVGRLGAGTLSDFMASRVMGAPAANVMALGDSQQPMLVEVLGQGSVRILGAEALVTRGGAESGLRFVLKPGPRCPQFLRVGKAYSLSGFLEAPGTSMPHLALRLHYPDGRREEIHVALAPDDRGGYHLYVDFTPTADGARYEVLAVLGDASSARLRSVSLRRNTEGLITPWLANVVERSVPPGLIRYVLVGEYGVITMGFTLALGIVLPIVMCFFLFLAALEDSGYLGRLTVLTNRVFNAMGLNGRACVPMVLGLACGTMAALAARVMDTRNARLLVIFLLALGVPCSAQLGMVMAMAASIGPGGIALVFGVVLAELFAAGYVASRILGDTRSEFLVEIPLLRWPTLSNVFRKTWQRSEWFLREALPYFLLGTALLALLAWTGGLAVLENAARPVLAGLLSLPPESAYPFLVGFLRRDYGAAGLFDLRYEGRLDNLQTVVALITMTLFVPCIANFLVIVKEQGLKRALVMVVVIMALALTTGGLVNWTLRALGVSL